MTPGIAAVLLGLALVAVPLAAEAQQAEKVVRIGILGTQPAAVWEAFRQGLRELGYMEGRNIILEWRWHEGRLDRAPAQASGAA